VTLETAGRLAAVVLGIVLLVSAAAKIARPGNAAEAAGLLLPWTALLAAGLLVAFTVLLLRVLARGEHPRCRCFGSLTAGRVTWWAVARNVVLLALAGLALAA
jgi:Methylamine utilisation protein MauE